MFLLGDAFMFGPVPYRILKVMVFGGQNRCERSKNDSHFAKHRWRTGQSDRSSGVISPCAALSLRSPCTGLQHHENRDLPDKSGYATDKATAEMPWGNLVELLIRIPLRGHSFLTQIKRSADAESSLVINRPRIAKSA
ncbi:MULTISPECIES: hypothetical protein [unclassified Burkholderia]|uniref:hypothetical protein n=1 Tax=unclassified Burkholderia TaxID=2613784 RepID=UPI0012E38224|nr:MULTISPECIES: hypothetical protein [unclassified Burkholderia]